LFVRQRLSSEPDRYRGRRRVPTPPRSRYAVVGVSAFVGAGVVALGSASNMPNVKDVNSQAIAGLRDSSVVSAQLDARANDNGRASRGNDRSATANQSAAESVNPDQVWRLPVDEYQFTAPFGVRFGKLHAGIDLAAAEGTPFKSIHAGTVTQAGYYGAYGNSITIKDTDGTETVYAHARRLLVKKGDVVKAGQVIAEIGNTGYSYGSHLHLEIHVNGTPVDPVPFLRERGVDIKLEVESVYAMSSDAS
jgi:murein DD-endopeptidase MepM/ murein hydrolase activator NlpD